MAGVSSSSSSGKCLRLWKNSLLKIQFNNNVISLMTKLIRCRLCRNFLHNSCCLGWTRWDNRVAPNELNWAQAQSSHRQVKIMMDGWRGRQTITRLFRKVLNTPSTIESRRKFGTVPPARTIYNVVVEHAFHWQSSYSIYPWNSTVCIHQPPRHPCDNSTHIPRVVPYLYIVT